jgi:hypothetical protein
MTAAVFRVEHIFRAYLKLGKIAEPREAMPSG